jgi:hypothetical protein
LSEIKHSFNQQESEFTNENGMDLKYSKKLMEQNTNTNLTNKTNVSVNLNQSEFMEKIDKIIRIESRERKMYGTNYSKENNRKPF